MKTERLKEIIAIIEDAHIDVLHIEENGFKLSYQKNGATPVRDVHAFTSGATEAKGSTKNEEDSSEGEQTNQKEKNEVEVITSPMIGTFYSRSEPEEDAYVHVGSMVTEGTTVCVLEAMKLMNEVVSGVIGEIVDVLVSDGDVIEYGQPLFKVRVGE